MHEFPDPSTGHARGTPRERSFSRRNVDEFLTTNREPLRKRVSLDVKRLLNAHPVFGLRTLAACRELTGWMPNDAFVNLAERKRLPSLKDTLTNDLLERDERTFLEALGILADLRSAGLITGEGKPNVTPRDMDRIGNILTGFLDDTTLSSGAKALRDASALIRLGLFDDMGSERRKRILPGLRSLLEEETGRALDRLDAELRKVPGEDAPDPVPPQALYGLFTLADIGTIREYVGRDDASSDPPNGHAV